MDKEHFDESKVKRDKMGRFAEMSSKEISDTIKQEIGGHRYIEAVNDRVPFNSLTSNQWRLWHQEQTQREKSYLLEKYQERRFVNVDGIFILTTGTFSKPKVEAIYKFYSSLGQEFKKILESRYGNN